MGGVALPPLLSRCVGVGVLVELRSRTADEVPRRLRPDEEVVSDLDAGIDEDRRSRVHRESQGSKIPCTRCAISSRCNNSCGCLNWQTTGTVNAVSPVLCRNEQMLLRVADEVGTRLYKERSPLFLHKHYNKGFPVLSLLEDTLARR